ncbi:MAG TPA: hypothetical protein VEB63_11185 [Chitinophagaceae bacterium]|nr:hypothetical protein [Chitinophagaceae bacterium]
MKRRKVILVAIAVLIIGGGWYGYKEYTRKVPDLSRVRPDITMDSRQLISSFEQDEAGSNAKYLDKIISVRGTVRAVERDETGFYTVILNDGEFMSSVRCSMDAEHQQDVAGLKEGAGVTIKGACTGFNSNELLGSDVILNRGVLVK